MMHDQNTQVCARPGSLVGHYVGLDAANRRPTSVSRRTAG
jgi:hypothetical protein